MIDDDGREPILYTESDLEEARKAGIESGARKELDRILALINHHRAELHDGLTTEQTDCERSLDWVARIITGTDELER
jgi:hypothetical protein